MFQVLAHPNLSHQLILVSVHAGQLTDVCENVLQTISQLEGIDVIESILDVRVHYQFSKPENFTTQVER